jgi:putative ABC transport system permease protein
MMKTMRARELLDAIWQDVSYALRILRKNPAFASTAILILAISIGGNTAMFTIIRAVLLKPLEYRDPNRLVRVSGGAAPARFEQLKNDARSFSGLAAFTGQENLSITGQGNPEVLAGARVSANFLQILGVQPMLGRSFIRDEDSPKDTAVAIISAELWQRRFAANEQIVGATALINAKPYTIIGVLPPHFDFPFPGLDVWMTSPTEWPLMAAKSRALSPFLEMFGRLTPGVNVEQANAELAVLQRQYVRAHPTMLDAKPKSQPRVAPLKEQLVANIRSMLWMLSGGLGFVLLIACANLTGLLLARAAARSREFAVRSALGAVRGRLIRQLLAESVLLAFAGGAGGVLLADWIIHMIRATAAADLPRSGEIHLDWLLLVFAATLSIGTGLLFGLAPSLAASQPDLMSTLTSHGDAASQHRAGRFLPALNIRAILVVSQVALSVVLLIGAALMMQSVMQLHKVDVGFNPANVLTTRISLPLSRYGADLKKTLFFEELIKRVESLPGVDSAAGAMFLPMTGFVGSPIQDAAKPALKLNERTIATILIVTRNYFRTLAVPMRRGRDFTEQDNSQAQRVAVIDEACARHFWPAYPYGSDPIGQHLLIGSVDPHPAEIVGIVAGVHQNLENTSWPDTVYVPFAQVPQPSAMLAVRMEHDPLRLTRAIQEQVWAIDHDQPVSGVRTMEDLIDAEIGERKLILNLLASFAGVALLLTLTGIYGVTAYSVARRTHEVVIRRALGAQYGDILRLVVAEAFGLSLVGVVIGVGGSLALTGVLKHFLFRLSATDPETFAGTAVLFILVALIASYIPANRATRIDPMTALRVE